MQINKKVDLELSPRSKVEEVREKFRKEEFEMEQYAEQRLTGERALFHKKNLMVTHCIFADGESPLKECENVVVKHTMFQWKYPLWYSKHISIEDSMLFDMARAGIWYADDLSIQRTTIEAPKTFRRCDSIMLEEVDMPHAEETLWNCQHISMKNVLVKGDYFGMNCKNVKAEHLTLIGDYCFDGCEDVEISHAKMISKDAFWNCRNVTVYDSYISGEYMGWNSENVTFVKCTLESLQGMCYMKNLVLKNCKLLNTNLAFEYSTVDSTIDSDIVSIKNPIHGRIVAKNIGEIIFDDPAIDATETKIMQEV